MGLAKDVNDMFRRAVTSFAHLTADNVPPEVFDIPAHEYAARMAQAEADWASRREINNRERALLHDPGREPRRESAAADQPQQHENEPAPQSTEQDRVDQSKRLEQADNEPQEKCDQPKLSK
jgi:hypothetical protein